MRLRLLWLVLSIFVWALCTGIFRSPLQRSVAWQTLKTARTPTGSSASTTWCKTSNAWCTRCSTCTSRSNRTNIITQKTREIRKTAAQGGNCCGQKRTLIKRDCLHAKEKKKKKRKQDPGDEQETRGAAFSRGQMRTRSTLTHYWITHRLLFFLLLSLCPEKMNRMQHVPTLIATHTHNTHGNPRNACMHC